MFSIARWSVAALAVFLPISSANAQVKDPAPPETTGPIHLAVVVSQHSGPPVSGLSQQDFKVIDNKIAQSMTSFQALGGDKSPVEILIVLDAVNATFSTVATERDQINHFLRAHEQLAHPTAVAMLTDTGLEIQKTTSIDGKEVSAALDGFTSSLRTIRRSSGVWGAEERLNISLSALHQLGDMESKWPGRKLVLWVSPGWPMLSGPGIQLDAKQEQRIFGSIVQISTELRKARVTLYALDALGARESLLHGSYYLEFVKGVTKFQNASLGNLGLQVIAAQTGGLVLNSNDLVLELEHCLSDITAYYDITYTPPPAEHRDEYHQITVEIDKPGLTPRTLQGYYSQP